MQINGGNKKQLNLILNGARASKEAIRRALWVTGLDLAGNGSNNSGTIKQAINRVPKRGRKYGTHQASAAGESPANITGKLRSSVYKRAHGYNEIDIGASADYASYLEEGTYKMARRNFVIRPILNHRRKIIMNFDRELSKILK